jgi:hypothetical protein
MSHPLDEARAKVRRARVHLQKLADDSTTFLRDHPYEIVAEKNRNTGFVDIVAHARGPEEPVPDDLGIVAGDALHNLRSALNYLAWRLSKGSGANDRATQFPIFFDEVARIYPEPVATRYHNAESRLLSRVDPADRALIERMQPYHGGRGELLQVIGFFNDMDKHRVIPARQAAIYGLPPKLYGAVSAAIVRVKRLVELRDGAVLASFAQFDVVPGEQVKVEFDSPPYILFGEPSDIRVNAGHMWKAARWVELILLAFSRRV